MNETKIVSFVVRFLEEESAPAAPRTWRGVIRHVQSREEVGFLSIEEALAFMARYVSLEANETAAADEGGAL
jgi:hypothetical protein